MFSTTPYFERSTGWVIVWVGDLSEAGLAEYLHEPGNSDIEAPISRFSDDLGLWYDHHLVWGGSVAVPQLLGDLADAVELDPPRLVSELRKRGENVKARCLLVLFEAKLVISTPRVFAENRLQLLGCWEEKSPVSY